MDWSSTSLVEAGTGCQRVRPPRSTDAVGATLRDGYPVGHRLPDDMRRLLGHLDTVAGVSRLTARG